MKRSSTKKLKCVSKRARLKKRSKGDSSRHSGVKSFQLLELPPEVLTLIISYLPLRSVAAFAGCSQYCWSLAWKAVEVIDFREFHVWSLSWQMDERCIPVLERCVHARKVTFNQKCTDASVVALSKLPCLEKLILNWCAITDGGLYVLSSVVQPRALRSLSLNFCSMITDNGISYLRTITTLQHLNMEICKGVTGLSLQHIAELGDLRRLTVSRQTDDEGLRQLRPLTRLEALKLNYCWNVTNQGVACLSSMQSLRALHICGIPSLSNRGVIPVLKKLTNLQHLTLSSLPSIGRPCLRYLTSLTRLEYLDCTGMNIPAGAIHSLPAFARLDPSAVMLFDWRVMVRSPNFPVEW